MKYPALFSFTLFYLLLSANSFAQSTSNMRENKYALTTDTLLLDTLSLIPGSIEIRLSNGEKSDTTFFHINYAEALLIVDRNKLSIQNISIDSLYISYRVFPFLLAEEIKHKDMMNIRPNLTGAVNPFLFNASDQHKDDVFKTEGLSKSGSISRGISFGNNQDVVVNSNLDLKLSGKLNNNIDILLAATDNNIPIQAEGNTQQLQEFDKVFIQLSDSKSKLIAGDFQITRPESYFMNFNKKAQGLNFSTAFQPKDFLNTKNGGTLKTTASAAVSKGKFARNQIAGIERNQGPYRLRGSENESFIIVLSGTEMVYLDGELLERGQDKDYVIDYNTAEIAFTPKRMITKDKRIIVDFQYSDKNYARSLLFSGNEYEQGKMKVRFNVYSEQDSKNQPLQQDLSPAQRLLLSTIGDNLNGAISPSYDSVAFSGNEVLYEKVDTVTGSSVFKDVFVYATDSDKAHYRVSFSNVGQGNGNYQQISSSANGKVFEWMMPDTITGMRNGSYEPVILLITPKKKQMVTFGTEYKLSEKSKFSVEGAFSNNDINTFSTRDSKDDKGYALKLNFDQTLFTSKEFGNSEQEIKKWNANVNYELVEKNFSPIERYRNIEFERDWNRATSSFLANQHISGTTLSYSKNNTTPFQYQFNSFLEDTFYNATKHNVTLNLIQKGFLYNFDGSLLNSKSVLNNTDYLKQKGGISKNLKRITVGIKETQELNRFHEKKTDTLQLSSFEFFEWEAFIHNPDTVKNKYEINYKQRMDFALKNNNLKKSILAEDIGLSMELLKNTFNQFRGNVIYRTLSILDSTITTQKPDNALVGRVEYNFNLLKGLFFSNTFYEIGSGLEVKKEFAYIEVAPGQGVYSWTDYNENGVKELNEFEIAAFQDQASYLKVYIPTNEYQKTYTNQFSEIVNIKPPLNWTDKKGIRKIASKFSNQTAYRVDRKTSNDLPEIAYNPFLKETADSTLITLNSSLRNTFYFNQMSPVFAMNLNYQENKDKSLLVNGFDSREHVFNEVQSRWNITQQWSLNGSYKKGRKISKSEYFSSKDYRIHYDETEPKLNYQPGTSFRVSLIFKYTTKQNDMDLGGQKAIQQNYGTEVKYTVLQKGSLNMQVNFIQIDYPFPGNTSLAFEMLEGLKAGKNATWGLTYQQSLSNNMQLNLNYDGRKSEGTKAIHTGGVQLRAFF